MFITMTRKRLNYNASLMNMNRYKLQENNEWKQKVFYKQPESFKNMLNHQSIVLDGSVSAKQTFE